MTALRVYIGWDAAEINAFPVCEASLRAHASVPVEVIPIHTGMLEARGLFRRTHRTDETGQMFDDTDGQPFSTQFSFGRFGVVPLEMDRGHGNEWVVFLDADMLWRANIEDLISLTDDDMAVMCVKHQHEPTEQTKILGQIQTRYRRKNWSSVMLIKPNRCPLMTVEALNTWSGARLHALEWAGGDENIGALPEAWNWLEGWSSDAIDPRLLHYTRGTPDMPGHADARCADEWRAYL